MIPCLRSSLLLQKHSQRVLTSGIASSLHASSSSSSSTSSSSQNLISTCCHPCSSSSNTTISSSLFLHATTTLLKPMRKRRLPVREPAAGDWLCSCGHSNSKFRRDCIKCNGPAPPLPLGESRPKLPGEDAHDWACACGKMNYRGNVNCHKCGMPKPAAPEAEEKNALWKCTKCACLNRVSRKFCFQCKALQNLAAVPVNSDGKAPSS